MRSLTEQSIIGCASAFSRLSKSGKNSFALIQLSATWRWPSSKSTLRRSWQKFAHAIVNRARRWSTRDSREAMFDLLQIASANQQRRREKRAAGTACAQSLAAQQKEFSRECAALVATTFDAEID